MQLIPVVDLLRGQAVRAVRGDRKAYRPLVSGLCEGSEPRRVARALTAHCGAPRLYVADLDALQGGAVQAGIVRGLLDDDPALELWLDAGFADRAAADALVDRLGADGARIVPVFASESLRTADALRGCFAAGGGGVLSLDRREGQRLDPAGCWDLPALWPARVIVMTLERVGAGTGPDLDTLRAVQARAPQAALVGAGGVRDEADLARAADAGATAWLVASALHDGRLARR